MTVKELRDILDCCLDDGIIQIGLQGYEHGKLRSVSYCPILDFRRFYGKEFVLLVDDPRQNGERISDEEFRSDLRQILNACTGSDYAGYLVNDDRFYNAVKENVEETSAWFDEGIYTEDDIRLAVGRVLLEELGVDYE